ncbi:hypothetical protein Taro_039514 [Colocasia esculenta]|uniref:Uncharacterized protein n=1 Tax=Colocasia esculenta TaxID=4460 RepID=A0A843WQE0_COLES|nr:hypothetical protein [Colocasia esculenta]
MSEDIDELVPMNRTDIDGVRLDTTLLGIVQEDKEAIYEDDDLLTEGSTNASDPTSSKIRKIRGKFKGLET